MFSRDSLVDLFRHMEWADAKVWGAVSQLPDDRDAKLWQWLIHIHTVQRAFLQVWTGRRIEEAMRRPEDFSNLDEVRRWAQAYYAEAHEIVGGFDESRLFEPLVMPWAARLAERLGKPPAL